MEYFNIEDEVALTDIEPVAAECWCVDDFDFDPIYEDSIIGDTDSQATNDTDLDIEDSDESC